MRDFAQLRWCPSGPRPHVFALPGPALHAACEQVLAQLPAWHPDWATILRPVPAMIRHLTVAWADVPTSTAPAHSWAAAVDALTRSASRHSPLRLTCTTATDTPGGIILVMHPTPAWNDLAESAGAALAQVFDPAAVRIDTAPHLAVAYGCRNTDTPPFTLNLSTAPNLDIDTLSLVDHDSFDDPGWNPHTHTQIHLADT